MFCSTRTKHLEISQGARKWNFGIVVIVTRNTILQGLYIYFMRFNETRFSIVYNYE